MNALRVQRYATQLTRVKAKKKLNKLRESLNTINDQQTRKPHRNLYKNNAPTHSSQNK